MAPVMLFSFFACVCLACCNGTPILQCNVTQNDNNTIYTLSPHVSDASCDYFWNAEIEGVLANNDRKNPQLVQRNDVNTLITAQCFEKLSFSRTCHPEGVEYTAKCATICTKKAVIQDEGPDEQVQGANHWLIPVVAAVVAVVVLAAVVYYVASNLPSEDSKVKPQR